MELYLFTVTDGFQSVQCNKHKTVLDATTAIWPLSEMNSHQKTERSHTCVWDTQTHTHKVPKEFPSCLESW